MPKLWIDSSEIGEHADAFLICEVDDLDAVFAQPIQSPVEVHGLSNNYFADAKLTHQTAAIPARRKRGDHNFIAVTALPAGFAKSIGFRVHGRIIFLNAAVVTAPEKFPLTVKKRRADRNASFSKTKSSLGNRDFEECEMILRFHFVLARLYLKNATRRQPFKTSPEEIEVIGIGICNVRGILAASVRILG